MARDDDDDVPWTRQLAVGVGVLVAVALVIGGVMSVVALGAAKVTGLGGAHASATARPSLYFPSDDPTTTPETFPDPNGSDEPSPSPSSSASPSAKPTRKARSITLQAFPQQVPPNERINLTGVYQGGEGARLQVQRFENGWVDFPVSASVSGGAFATYIYTGRSGPNRFRVIDKEADKASNPVRVRVG
jgi:hypothetical protein